MHLSIIKMSFYDETKALIAQMMQLPAMYGCSVHKDFITVGNETDQQQYRPLKIRFPDPPMPHSGMFLHQTGQDGSIHYVGVVLNKTDRVLFSIQDICDFVHRTRHLYLQGYIIGITGQCYGCDDMDPPVTRYAVMRGGEFLDIVFWLRSKKFNL